MNLLKHTLYIMYGIVSMLSLIFMIAYIGKNIDPYIDMFTVTLILISTCIGYFFGYKTGVKR